MQTLLSLGAEICWFEGENEVEEKNVSENYNSNFDMF